MGLREVRYDMNHGASRRILMPTLERWAASHPPDAEVLEVGAGHYDHRPFFRCTLTKFDADTSQNPDIVGDAHAMPIEDDRFDGALAIGVLEHVEDPYQVVREMYRVLKPGGSLAILEITQPRRQPLATFFGLWFDRIVPMLGKFAGDSSAYTYLPESVRSFPDAETLGARLDAAGFRHVRWTLMAGSIIALHSGIR